MHEWSRCHVWSRRIIFGAELAYPEWLRLDLSGAGHAAAKSRLCLVVEENDSAFWVVQMNRSSALLKSGCLLLQPLLALIMTVFLLAPALRCFRVPYNSVTAYNLCRRCINSPTTSCSSSPPCVEKWPIASLFISYPADEIRLHQR